MQLTYSTSLSYPCITPHTRCFSERVSSKSISKHYKHTLTVKEREKERAEKPNRGKSGTVQAMAEGAMQRQIVCDAEQWPPFSFGFGE